MTNTDMGNSPAYDLPKPSSDPIVARPSSSDGADTITADMVLARMNDAVWEEFVLEWATGLEVSYERIKRLGGPGDKGIDVAAFLTQDGLRGDWHCFQCKFYSRPLQPEDLWPEIYKLIHHVEAGHYNLPSQYNILAPRQCGRALNLLLSDPVELRKGFLERVQRDRSPLQGASSEDRMRIHDYAERHVDFKIFEAEQLHNILTVHSGTRWHSFRFNTPLPLRPSHEVPPVDTFNDSFPYIAQLKAVYRERWGATLDLSLDSDFTGLPFGGHYQRQRESFYAAEALREFARLQVPQGTFENLQDNIFHGVVTAAEGEYTDGFARLSAVMSQSTALSLTANKLLQVTETIDRHGICHQLANVNKLRWVN